MAVQISWWKQDNLSQWANWAVGTVDAGSTSQNSIFLIWNNRGGSTAISNAESCTLTTKDVAGGDTGELVTDKWIWARVDTMGETSTFAAIGGTSTKAIKAGGTAPAGTISGAANDGTVANAKNNFAQVTLQARPTVTATAGNVNFLLRLQYTFQ